MKRWAALTVLLYSIALILLSAPLVALAFGRFWGNNDGLSWGNNDGLSFAGSFEVYQQWHYWLWLAIMVAGQALLLLLPLDLRERKLTPRRPLFVPVLTATFFLANLCAAGCFSVLCAVFKDDAFNVIAFVARLVRGNFEWNPAARGMLQTAGVTARNDWFMMLSGSLTIIMGFWAIWALVFHRFLKSDSSDALLGRITRWLLRGSILELLVAVPSHIIVRRRTDCCAPMGTFWGIALGVSVMLLCFGPGVFFLFADRFERLRSKSLEGPATTS